MCISLYLNKNKFFTLIVYSSKSDLIVLRAINDVIELFYYKFESFSYSGGNAIMLIVFGAIKLVLFKHAI